MATSSVGELLRAGRERLRWSQATLALEISYSVVMVSKVESGAKKPSPKFLSEAARALDLDLPTLEHAAEAQAGSDSGGALKIVKAIQLAKENSRRANALRARAEQLGHEANTAAQALDAQAEDFAKDVVGPFAEILSRTSDIPEDLSIDMRFEPTDEQGDFAEALKDSQIKTSKGLLAMLRAGLLGAGAGGGFGVAAAATTYATVASFATASTGVAIASLAGVAAQSATLAAIGGGTLASGAAGIAGGTALLTTMVTAPILLVATAAVVASGGKSLDKQKAIERRIDEAEDELSTNETVVRTFIRRAGKIEKILNVGNLAATRHLRTARSAVQNAEQPPWSSLSPDAVSALRRLAEIALACLTVLSLPIGMALKATADAEPTSESGDSPLQLTAQPDVTEQYIDYAIEEAFRQVVR